MWKGAEADIFRNSINYNGVFIPADAMWRAQLESAESQSEGVAIKAFSIHTLTAFIDTFDFLLNNNELSAEDRIGAEIDFVESACEFLNIKPTIKSVLGVKISLRKILVNLNPRLPGPIEFPFNPENILAVCDGLIEIANHFLGYSNKKWALMFDELEIVPECIQRILFSSLRSCSPRIVLKLAYFPYNHTATPDDPLMSASERQDYEVIPLWYSDKKSARSFSQDLLVSSMNSMGLDSSNLEVYFGSSIINGVSESIGAYSKRFPDESGHIYNRLAMKDASFASYLVDKKLDLNNLKSLTESERASKLRKANSIIIFRDYFLKSFGKSGTEFKVVRRSRRQDATYSLYAGIPSLIDITEGNPRVCLNLFFPMLREIVERMRNGRKAYLDPSHQGVAIENLVSSTRSYLKTIPATIGIDNSDGLLQFLDRLGVNFNKLIIDREFKADLYSSFTVDSIVDENTLEALGAALNSGAVVYIPDNDVSQAVIGSLRGKRFRLSHTLAPFYALPLVKGKSLSLLNVFKIEEMDNQVGMDFGE
ncbi:hypothetical protein A3746_01200 [Oleibacter sp. HI0075]|nr:hypothetical protein A3746_01200 [Oleibacter sp. HI0075]